MRPMTSSGAAPHMELKPALAKMIGLRLAGAGSAPEGSVTWLGVGWGVRGRVRVRGRVGVRGRVRVSLLRAHLCRRLDRSRRLRHLGRFGL